MPSCHGDLRLLPKSGIPPDGPGSVAHCWSAKRVPERTTEHATTHPPTPRRQSLVEPEAGHDGDLRAGLRCRGDIAGRQALALRGVLFDRITVAHCADRNVLAADDRHHRGASTGHHRACDSRQVGAPACGTPRSVISWPLMATPPAPQHDRPIHRAPIQVVVLSARRAAELVGHPTRLPTEASKGTFVAVRRYVVLTPVAAMRPR